MKPRMFRNIGGDGGPDFRSRATFGVAMTALLLLLPVAFLDLINGELAVGIGAFAVVFILAANAWIVLQGRCHQNLTQYGLVPAGMVFMTTVFQIDGLIATLWCYPAVLAVYCMLSERKAWFANATILILALPMIWHTLEFAYAIRVTTTLVATSIFAAILVNVIDRQRRQLQKQLTLDPLTGLLNRLTFNDRMQQVVYEHIHQDKKVSLLAIDVDHFKSLNDTHGHAVGDRVLRAIGQTFRETLRQDDAVFRMGGEEFTAILIGADEDAATETAERVRQHVAEHSFNIGSAVTVSIGVSEHRYDESWENWAKRGDDRLYAAKRKGRNRVVAAHLQEIGNVHLVNLI